MYTSALLEAGLTKSETKVYLALLRNGELTKTPLVKEAKISPSKVYDVLNKLKEKGLVSEIIKRNIKHFNAAQPIKIKEYLQNKRIAINDAEKKIQKILPNLLYLEKTKSMQPEVSTFFGWEGLGTVYETLIEKAKPQSAWIVIGGSQGEDQERTERFFSKYSRMAYQKGMQIRILFDETARAYVKNLEKRIGKPHNKRFIFERKTPTEVAVIEDTTLIIILRKDPVTIRIINQETADSFKQYFEELWKSGRP